MTQMRKHNDPKCNKVLSLNLTIHERFKNKMRKSRNASADTHTKTGILRV